MLDLLGVVTENKTEFDDAICRVRRLLAVVVGRVWNRRGGGPKNWRRPSSESCGSDRILTHVRAPHWSDDN